MIKSILDPSFSSYGEVDMLRKDPNASFVHMPIYGNPQLPLYRFSYATHWDYIDGMTVLVIQDGNALERYYLDRAVTLYSGVCFGFYSLGQTSTVAADASHIQQAACVEYVDIAEAPPKSQPLNFFTLFRQTGHTGFFFRGEQHLPLELVYLEKGTLHNYCDGQTLILHPNEFLIFGPDQWHMQYADEEVQFLTISFSWEGHNFSHLFNRVIAASSEIQHSVHALLKEYEQELPEKESFLNAHMQLLFLQILRFPTHRGSVKKTSPASEQAHHLIVDKAMRIVSERIYGKLNVTELARAVNVSNSQLTSLFHHYLNMTPAKYITHIRLEESKNLLTENKLSVGEIADRLGYANMQHFSKQFRNWFGCSPSAYAPKENK